MSNFVSLDDNHYIVRDFLMWGCAGYDDSLVKKYKLYKANYRGLLIVAYDMSKHGGAMSDWLVLAGSTAPMFVEVKTPEAYKRKDHDMTAGEMVLAALYPDRFFIVQTFEDVSVSIYRYLCQPS